MLISLLASFVIILSANLSIASKSIILSKDDSLSTIKQNDPLEIDHHKIYENGENDTNFDDEQDTTSSIELNYNKKSKPDCPFEHREQHHNDDYILINDNNIAVKYDKFDTTSKLKNMLPLLRISTFDVVPINNNYLNHDKAGYNAVNNRFITNNTKEEEKEEEKNAVKDMKLNWSEWKNLIFYHASGKNKLDLQRQHLNDKFRHKSKKNDNLNERPLHDNIGNQVLSAKIISLSKPKMAERMSKNAIKVNGQEVGELDQQDDLKYFEPVLMYMMDDEVRMLHVINNDEESQSEKQVLSNDSKEIDLLRPTASGERIRNSLLKAADVARQLSSTSTTIKPFSSNNNQNKDNANSGWSVDTISEDNSPASVRDSHENIRASNDTFDELKPKFLGYGQLQRIESNDRLQVRLNCQFGEDYSSETDNNNYKNMTISQVEWSKFDNYNNNHKMAQKQTPPFDCVDNNCKIKQVKTDVVTTVHPRPAVQNYINTKVPSYSVTLHEVNDNHLGVYKCSALRQLENGQKELVYRIILLD